MYSKARRYIRFVLSAAITIGIFILLFHKIPLGEVVNTIKKANFKIILLILGISLISNTVISAKRWKLILERLGCTISLKESLFIKLGSDSVVSLLPIKIGEFSRMEYLKRLKNISYSKSLISIISEYFLNIFMLILFAITGAVIHLFQGSRLNVSVSSLRTLLPSFLLFSEKSHTASNTNIKLINNYFGLFKKSLGGLMMSLRSPSILFYSFLFMLAEIVNIYLLSRALHYPFPLYNIVLFVPIVILISSLPLTIAGLGLREAVVILFFLKLAPFQVLLSLGILYSFTEQLFPMIIGTTLTGPFLIRIYYGKNENKLFSASS